MTSGVPIRGSLDRYLGKSDTSPEELEALRKRAWHEHGIAVLDPEKVTNFVQRACIETAANARYGQRRGS